MHKKMSGFSLALGALGAVLWVGSATTQAFAQNAPAQNTTEQNSYDQNTADVNSGLQPMEFLVDTKMVKAVQSALISRGHYRARPNGVLDAETREGLRSFQSAQGLNATGRIDGDTLSALGVDAKNPVVASERRNGFIPRVGYAVKDTTVASKDLVVNSAKTVGRGTRKGYDTVVNGTKTGLNKTKDVTVGTFRRSREVTVGMGHSASDKMQSAGSKTSGALQRTTTKLAGRSDTDIHLDVRDILDDDADTNQYVSSVKLGAVTLKLPVDYQGDVSPTITRVRKVPGVRSVVIVQP